MKHTNTLVILLVTIAITGTISTHFVSAPVANLRKFPIDANLSYGIDYAQLSQLLFGEVFQVSSEKDGWSYGRAVWQSYFDDNEKVGYPGWIKSDQLEKLAVETYRKDLVVKVNEAWLYKQLCVEHGCVTDAMLMKISLGCYLMVQNYKAGWFTVILPNGVHAYIIETAVTDLRQDLTEHNIRKNAVNTALSMLGWNYFWGGRSHFSPELWNDQTIVTGVDCSGLTSLSYKANGLALFRDAGDQYWTTSNVSRPDLLVDGDLFFFGKNEHRITHVMMMYSKNNIPMLVESTTSSGANGTRVIPLVDRFGSELHDLTWSMPVGGTRLFWGSPF
eukprot:TRINITY_DN6757_c0_g1_i1.p1 TRINITY_DN6757_c0_g1~~TRINITY_DN6757_c0_g1_i1.p1  ORF type:complete len:332 (+),score=52.26 TRINITY_DN6757_c0_g1_i1:16-1011(+)